MSHRNTLLLGFGLILASLLLQCQEIQGKEFLVGDDKGWSPYPGLSDWPNGKTFTPGDILVFKYNNANASVRSWDDEIKYKEYPDICYAKCDNSLCPNYEDFNSGNDNIVLKEGKNYFFSPDHDRCDQGFKIKVCAEFDGKRTGCN
ncbi:hypothetical protein ACLB2K_049887 [Fragaria x ananassa]